jgi:hypothetical protein
MLLSALAEHIGINISLLCKIEHRVRQLQGHMIKPTTERYHLISRELQIQLLDQKIQSEFGEAPYLNKALQILITTSK